MKKYIHIMFTILIIASMAVGAAAPASAAEPGPGVKLEVVPIEFDVTVDAWPGGPWMFDLDGTPYAHNLNPDMGVYAYASLVWNPNGTGTGNNLANPGSGVASHGTCTAENIPLIDGVNGVTLELNNFGLSLIQKRNWGLMGQSGDHRVYTGGGSVIKVNGETKLTTINSRITMDVDWPQTVGPGDNITGSGFATIDAVNSDPAWVTQFDNGNGQVEFEYSSMSAVVQNLYGSYNTQLKIKSAPRRENIEVHPINAVGLANFPNAHIALDVVSFTPGGVQANMNSFTANQVMANPGGAAPAGISQILPNCYWELGTVLDAINTDVTFDLAGLAGLPSTANLRILKRENTGAAWTVYANQTVVDATRLRANGVTSFSEFGLGEAPATPGWPTSWQYSKIFNVTGSTNDLTDYQVRVPVTFAAGKMNSDFSDIRFTTADGSLVLSHWMESSTASTSAVFWVKVPAIPTTGTTIRMYYGNTSATSASDFNNTFIAGNNDFEQDALDTLYDAISFWEHNSWTQNDAGTIGGVPSGYTLHTTDTRRYSGAKSVYSFVRNANSGGNTNPNGRHSIQDIYTEYAYKVVSDSSTLYIWRTDVSYTTSSRYYWTFSVVLEDGLNTQEFLLHGRAWGNSEGVPGNYVDTHDLTATGADGQVWYRHSITIPGGFNKSKLVVKTRHQQDSWDGTTAESSLYYDLIGNFRLRKFASLEPVATVAPEPVVLSNWLYRKSISITGSATAQTDYQVRVPVNFATGHMNADFSDIIFVAGNGTTVLNHWLEKSTASTDAIFWVKVPSIPTGGTTIYMHYGNPSAGSASNGENTFIFFDDFSTDKLSQYNNVTTWNVGGGGRIKSIENGQLKDADNGVNQDESVLFTKNGIQLPNLAFDVRLNSVAPKSVNHWQSHYLSMTVSQTSDANEVRFGYSHPDNTGAPLLLLLKDVGAATTTIGSDTSLDGTGKTLSIAKIGSDFNTFVDGQLKWSFTDSSLGSNSMFAGVLTADGWSVASTSYWDDFRIRNFALPEPLVTVGGEQVPAGPVHNTTTGNNYATIQSAIADAATVSGNVITVDPGTYTENVNFNGKNITLRSTGGASVTTINGGQAGSVVRFVSGETSSAVLDGFTLTNGSGHLIGGGQRMGGGVYAGNNSSPTITNCRINGNTTNSAGGGIMLWYATATISNCVITNNTGNNGGGIGNMFGQNATIINCVISGNSSGSVGGGISSGGGPHPNIINCTIVGNYSAQNGGGIHADSGSAGTITNSIVWNNTVSSGIPEIGSGTVTYSDVKGGYTGTGNIDADPLFVNAGTGDYHLQLTSPCINTGYNTAVQAVVTTDFEGDPRIRGGIVDMGADEAAVFTLTIAKNGNGTVTPSLGPHTYAPGASVNLVAAPDTGYTFTGWTGDVSTVGNVNNATTTITMNGNYTVTANFVVSPVHNITTGKNFTTIQAAIDDATTLDGHIITIDPGTYTTNVDVTKGVTIGSASGPAEDTIIAALNPADHVFDVTHDNVTIENLTIRGVGVSSSSACIKLNNVTAVTIRFNNIGSTASTGQYGVLLYRGGTNLIYKNSFNSLRTALRLEGSPNNNISSNTFIYDELYDIYLTYSPFGTGSNGNIILNNTCGDGAAYGIYIYDSNKNTVLGNTIENKVGSNGIDLGNAQNNIISRNDIHHVVGPFASGIHVGSASYPSQNNTFYFNSLHNNTTNVLVENSTGRNTWNSTTVENYLLASNNQYFRRFVGNYYDTYTGNDTNGDGVGETQYNIVTDNPDIYPLVSPLTSYVGADVRKLTVDHGAGGHVTTPGEGEFFYAAEASINLTATPDAGYRFVNWTGDVSTIASVTSASTTITMNADYAITANFISDIPIITVTSPNGGEYWGIDTSKVITWTSVNIPGNMNISISRDNGVNWTDIFTNIPNSGSQSWLVEGPTTDQARIRITDCSNNAVTDMSDANYYIVPNLPDLVVYSVTTTWLNQANGTYSVSAVIKNIGGITAVGGGTTPHFSVTKITDNNGVAFEVIDITQNLNPGQTAGVGFSEKVVSGDFDRIDVIVDSGHDVTESNEGNNIFTTYWPGYTLTTTVLPTGSGTLAKSPDQANYGAGTAVQLTAVPATGWQFSNWSGDASGTTNPLSVTMNANKAVTANFAQIPPPMGRIAFVSARDGKAEIYTMNPDGSNQTRITNNAFANYYPAISPDGTKIAFSSQRNNNWDIYVMSINGNNLVQLTNDSFEDYEPAWSPDGTQIAFATNRSGAWQIYKMNSTNGSSLTRVTTNAYSRDPDWSSTGLIAYQGYGAADDIYAINSDGTGEHVRYNKSTNDDNPAWSPDGVKVAFSSTPFPETTPLYSDIWTVQSDSAVPLTNHVGTAIRDILPDWSPDGQYIAFESINGSDYAIYTMRADGTGVTKITSSGIDVMPSWGPAVQIPRYTLTLTATAGAGTVVVNPAQPDGGYDAGTSVSLTPAPFTGWIFSHWSGDGSGNANPLSVTMSSNKTITANFTQTATYTLTINMAGNGTVARNPEQATYVSGTSVQLSATPAAGWVFSHWSGDANGNVNPLSVTMSSNKTITANFVPFMSGAVSWWPMNGNANDMVGGNHGTLHGGIFTAGRIGQAVRLDGIDDYVDFGNGTGLNFGTGNFTFSLWVNFASTSGEQVIIEKYIETENSATRTGWSLVKLSNNTIRFGGAGGGSLATILDAPDPGLTAGVWYHFAVVRSGNNYTLYLYGTPIATGTTSIVNFDSTATLKLGHRGNSTDTPGSVDNRGFFLNGSADDVNIFNRALTSVEVQAMLPVSDNISIGIIKSNPSVFVGQVVKLGGTYRGWESGHGSPPVTRSDWVIQDATGAMYVTGPSRTIPTPTTIPPTQTAPPASTATVLRFPEDIGKPISILGIVRLKNGVPYIEIQKTSIAPTTAPTTTTTTPTTQSAAPKK